MTTSEAGLEMIEGFESLRLSAYADGLGIPTIGYGHTWGVKLGDVCTQDEAREWLAEDMTEAEAAVARFVKVPLNQNQYDALVSLCFNVGGGALERSTLISLLNRGAFAGAANQFLVWNKIKGAVSAGLENRRMKERALFLTPAAG